MNRTLSGSIITLSPSISQLWLALGVITTLGIVMGIIFIFHWHSYGIGAGKAWSAEVTYFIGLAILLIIAASSLAATISYL